jgi:UDP-N-acetylmuramyl pentapeptide phosphotransferase/UDP-N-acetylglucosamine-1-phosphate transferase
MEHEIAWWFRAAGSAAVTALLSALLIAVLRPWLLRYAVARPNARSSHKIPTPQGGGIAVVVATITGTCCTLYLFAGAFVGSEMLLPVFIAVVLTACLGAADDIHSIEVFPRLAFQAVATAIVIYAMPSELRVLSMVPLWVERLLLLICGLWFINLVNFMDGLDWMTVAEVVPITVTLTVIAELGGLPSQAAAVAVSLCGAMIGFAFFNRPVAKLFLGDVGSLPIGLLLGWLLLLVASRGYLAAAILMPLYYLSDATITLARRLFRIEPIWQAHRTHFYQIATDHGFSVIEIIALVFVTNIGLCMLAVFTVIAPGKLSDIAALVVGALIVSCLLFAFAKGKNSATVI